MASTDYDFTFEVDGLDEGTLRVVRFEGREGISETFEFDLELCSPDPDIVLEDVVGKPAVLEIHTDDEPRRVHGLVSRFEVSKFGKKLAFYRARLVPRAWVLNLASRSRIFQDMKTQEIVQTVLAELDVPKMRFSLNRSYKPRLYCVQYRETDFAFVSRLMEEEGIFYYFAPTDDVEEMVIADNPDVHESLPCGVDPVLPFREEEAGLSGTVSITHFAVRQSMRTGAVTLREFDFKKPSLDMTVKKESDTETSFEYYDYPGEYPEPGLGKSLAEIRLQQLRTGREIVEGESDCRPFTPGFKFELSGHPRDALNAEYLLIGVRHSGAQPQAMEEESGGEEGGTTVYTNRFYAIPATVPFRPRRRTPRPVVEGVQTAIVTGSSGEEIHVDEHGRVKVHFHWDREGSHDDKSSCWVRVAQLQTSGSMLLPRVGWEVIVDFQEGDPDRPIIIGRLHNGGEPGPYALPENKTQMSFRSSTSPGGAGANEIRLEDSSGKMHFFMHASKDMNIVVENNQTLLVEVDDEGHVKGKQTLKVDGNQSDTIGGNRTIEVTGDHTESIKGKMDLKVKGDETIAVDGGRKDTVKGVSETKIDGNVTEKYGGKHELDVTGDETIKIGGAWKQQAKSLKHVIQTTSKETVAATKKTTVGGMYTIVAAGKFGVTGSSVAIKSAGKIAIEATTIEIKASAKIELQAGGNTISLSPGQLDIKGAGIVSINGSLVKIN